MAWNGSGTFNRLYNWGADKIAGVKITASRMDGEFAEYKTGLENCVTRDGQNAATANLPMGTNRHTGVGNAVARTDYAAAAQIVDGSLIELGTVAGTDTITAAAGITITAYAQGQMFNFVAAGTNTGATTINIDGLGAKAIQKRQAALAAGDIASGDAVQLYYDGTQFQITSPITASISSASDTAEGIVELATDAETATGTDTARAVTPANAASAYVAQGTHTVFIPAGAMRPTVSNGCASLTDVETTAGRPDLQVLDFDAAADEHAQFQIAFPKSWDEGTITFQVWWTTTATDTDGVAWGLQGVACSDGDTADVAYGTAVVVTDAGQSTAEDVYVTAESAAVTIAGTPAAADLVFFRLFRDVSDAADTMAEDARLIGIKLFYTVAAKDDA